MSIRRTVKPALVMVLIATLAGPPAATAFAVPSAQGVARDRAALDAALKRYSDVQRTADEMDAQLEEVSAQLDDAIAEEAVCQTELQARVVTMYRAGDDTTLALLLGARDIQELAERLDMVQRLARADAENIQSLKTARAAAQRSADELLALQAEQARSLDALGDEVAAARAELARSEADLREYEARLAAEREAAARAAAARQAARRPPQKLTGTGEWQSAVASHYSRSFTGRGASGERIGPYSMIVAHKTLPFGTLIEFEYKGKRAVARVADRGPYTPGRTFDLGPGVVRVLDFNGVHEVRYRIVSR